MPRVRKKWVHG